MFSPFMFGEVGCNMIGGVSRNATHYGAFYLLPLHP